MADTPRSLSPDSLVKNLEKEPELPHIDTASVASSKLERRFLRKLDLCLLTWAWFAYCVKQIDSSNYKTAYTAGMKEDLHLSSNELNYMDTCYRVGYAVFLIPSQVILTKVSAGYWLPALELGWGVLTGLMACMKSATGIYVLRFFIGVFEASSYPGIITLLCSYYSPPEIATRISIFGTSYPAASIFTGFMQAALHKSMEGKAGLRGYRWLFIFNALMTVIVALLGFVLIPGDPTQVKVRWLNDEEREMARERVLRAKKLPPTRLSLATLKKVFTSWPIYLFSLAYATWSWAQNSNSWILLFLKAVKNADGSARFGISELNVIPIGGYVLQIIAMLFFGWLSDRTGWRASLVVVQQLTLLLGTLILSCWPPSFGLKMFAYYVLWLSNAAGPILVAWMSDITPSPEQRSIIIGCCVTLVYAVDSFANILIYPAKEAPNYRIGYKAATAFGAACIVFTLLFWWQERRTRAARLAAQEQLLEDMNESARS